MAGAAELGLNTKTIVSRASRRHEGVAPTGQSQLAE